MKQLFYNSWVANIFFLITILGVNYVVTKQYETGNDPFTFQVYNAISLVVAYGMAVIHNVYIIRLLTEKKRYWYWRYALLILLWMAVSAVIQYSLRAYIFDIRINGEAACWSDAVIFSAVGLFVGIGLWFIYRQATLETRDLKISLLLREKEIQYLQSQLNPHFFFNTLNNLYGVSLRYPQKTPELILSISELMRYQLESSQKQQVPLEEELQFIRNYIHLERARVRQRCQVHFRKKGNEEGLLIAPLILIAFIENAFKYAPSSIQASFIKVELAVKRNILTLKVSNKVPPLNKELVSSSGVGLRNVKQRLRLMYPEKHQLTTYEENNVYYIALQLTLQYAKIPMPDSGR